MFIPPEIHLSASGNNELVSGAKSPDTFRRLDNVSPKSAPGKCNHLWSAQNPPRQRKSHRCHTQSPAPESPRLLPQTAPTLHLYSTPPIRTLLPADSDIPPAVYRSGKN